MGLGAFIQKVYNAQVGGTGVIMTKYPVAAVGTALKASGNTTGAYKFAAVGANTKAIIAAGALTAPFKIAGYFVDTPSAASIFNFRIGRHSAAGATMTQVIAESGMEVATDAGGYVPVFFPPGSVATINVDANNGVMGDAASSNAGADDTINMSVFINTLLAT